MHAIPNHTNSNFQIVHFLVGSCHTPDGAYALLCNLKESREMALAQLRSAGLKQQAKVVRAKRAMQSKDEAERLEGEAELAEIEDNLTFSQRNIDAAQKELAFINKCIERIQPYRVHAHLPDDEAHQAAQQEEWKLELIRRAENYLLTSGTLPADHYDTMRMHPEFVDAISPCIQSMLETMAKPGGREQLLHNVEVRSRNSEISISSLMLEDKEAPKWQKVINLFRNGT